MLSAAPQDCYTPVDAATAAAEALAARALEAHRAVRFDALINLVSEVQRRRVINEVADVVARRWKHCATVGSWRLSCRYGAHGVLVQCAGTRVSVQELPVAAFDAFDAEQWQRCMPQTLAGESLAQVREQLPPELAAPGGQELCVLPILQERDCVGMLSALGLEQPFDALDRKFIALVGGAMVTRVVAILTEQTLSAELLRAERQVMEQQQVALLGRLVNGVAHELNTPLGIQLSACDSLQHLLQAQTLDPLSSADVFSTLALVGAQAKRGAHIVRRLKSLSALTAGTPRLPTPLVEELELIAASHAEGLGAMCVSVDGDRALSRTLDRHALAAVITELLDNVQLHAGAADASYQAYVQVHGTPELCVIDILDAGPGLDAENAATFFQPFHSSRQADGHLGLGGYLVQQLVRDALGGEVELLKPEGGGTCVRISLRA